MKKYVTLTSIAIATIIFSNCNSAKKAATTPVVKSTYANDVAVMIMNNCAPCHIPAKGGFKKAYDNFDNVKTDIDEIIRRIELNPAEKGFMPFKKPAKLNDSVILVFKKWRDDGLLEK
jgi:mono/diheme cytochrome c family protein